MLSAAYGGAARLRRTWYERRPHLRRRLSRPVISIGNLVVGGSSKTPATIALARLLLERRRRPAVLTRGYGRRQGSDGVLVVSDDTKLIAPVEQSGDEPWMMARALPGVPVLVGSDRYLAGQLAIARFDADVTLLDDGFQHLQLERDVDLLLVSPGDLDERPLPSGRLREPLSAGRAADAVLVHGTEADAAGISATLGVDRAFRIRTRFGPLRDVRAAHAGATGEFERQAAARVVVAAAGIARPERFYASLRSLGWQIAREMSFGDHHWFTPRDVARIEDAARETSAALVVVTEKDAVRLEAIRDSGSAARDMGVSSRVTWAYLPMELSIEPLEEFTEWLIARL